MCFLVWTNYFYYCYHHYFSYVHILVLKQNMESLKHWVNWYLKAKWWNHHSMKENIKLWYFYKWYQYFEIGNLPLMKPRIYQLNKQSLKDLGIYFSFFHFFDIVQLNTWERWQDADSDVLPSSSSWQESIIAHWKQPNKAVSFVPPRFSAETWSVLRGRGGGSGQRSGVATETVSVKFS